MEFSVFANKMYSGLGEGNSISSFTHSLFDAIVANDSSDLLELSPSTYKSYYSGAVKTTQLAKRISAHCDTMLFADYINAFPESALENLCELFSDELPDINMYNAGEQLARLFMNIILEAAGSKRRTPKEKEPAEAPQASYRNYIDGIVDNYLTVKTILYQERLVPFYEIYTCNDVRVCNYENKGSHKTGKACVHRNIDAKWVLSHTHYGILKGAGGIGKSMMMRHA